MISGGARRERDREREIAAAAAAVVVGRLSGRAPSARLLVMGMTGDESLAVLMSVTWWLPAEQHPLMQGGRRGGRRRPGARPAEATRREQWPREFGEDKC